ncbi:MAG: ATP-binding protein [Syntrophobacteraceae bacterium]|nr:ATP-binding protein [Syntrophobacteraceae bacterium]
MATVMFLGWIVTLGGVIVLVREIRRRRRIETMLRESRYELDRQVRERTKELVQATEELRDKAETIDLVHDAVIVRDCEARITFWSRGAEETYGFTPEQALGQVSHELLKTAFPTAIADIEKTAMEKGEWKGELKHRKASGEPIVVDSRWAVNIGREGKPTGFLEVNRDITARKIAEGKLRKADRAFKALSECNHAMVRQTEEMELFSEVCKIMVETGGYRMAWVGFAENDACQSVRPIVCAGYDEGYLALANLTWADNERGRGPCGTSIRTGKMSISQNALTNPAFVPWRTEATKRGYASSVSLPLIVENRVIGAFTVYASEADAFDEEEANLLSKLAGNISYGVAAMRMAKERLRSEKELRVYASRLETINAELQEFAFVASHDLQEPLRKIQTFCDLAIKNRASGLGTKTEDYLERVANSAGRMRQLLRGLLEFSRIASGAQSFTRIDLTETAREAADIFEPTLQETGCEIAIHELPSIEADRSQMLHLFQNLIANSLKYRNDTAPRIEIWGEIKSDFCEIAVKDNGIGFEQQYCGLIFKPFQRLHKRDEYSGSGMGLAICRKIVERHAGAISGCGEPGKGAVFTVRLPLKQARLESVLAAGLP